jgi:hypothetical protein
VLGHPLHSLWSAKLRFALCSPYLTTSEVGAGMMELSPCSSYALFSCLSCFKIPPTQHRWKCLWP